MPHLLLNSTSIYVIISKDPWQSHLLLSVWQWYCHYLSIWIIYVSGDGRQALLKSLTNWTTVLKIQKYSVALLCQYMIWVEIHWKFQVLFIIDMTVISDIHFLHWHHIFVTYSLRTNTLNFTGNVMDTDLIIMRESKLYKEDGWFNRARNPQKYKYQS